VSGFSNKKKTRIYFFLFFRVGKIVLAYQPPNNVKEKLQEIVQNVFSDQNAAEPLQIRFTDRARKFQVQGNVSDAPYLRFALLPLFCLVSSSF
jgi:hypothetical protein